MPQRLSQPDAGVVASVTDYDLIAFTHTYSSGVPEQRVATAVVVGGKVKVVVWRVEANGHLQKLSESGTGMVATSVGIARCGTMNLSTSGGSAIPLFAVAGGLTETWVNFYAIDKDGVLGPFEDVAGVNLKAKAIRGPQSVSSDLDSDVHFAMIDAADRLCIAGFRWKPNDGQIMGPYFTGQAADEHGTVTSLAAAKLAANRMVTITQSKTQPHAKVIVWAEGTNPWATKPSEKSEVFDRVHDSGSLMGRAGHVAVAAPEDGSGHFLTAYQAVETSTKRLKLRSWRSGTTGVEALAHTGDQGDPVKSLDVAVLRTLSGGGYRAVTATQEADDKLKIASWNVSAAGDISPVAATIPTGVATRVRLARLHDPLRFATVVANSSSGSIKVIIWGDDA